MLFKLLPFVVLAGIGIRFLASIAAVNAGRKRLKALQEGRLAGHYAEKEAFWRNVDRFTIVLIAIAAVWYIIGVVYWLLGS